MRASSWPAWPEPGNPTARSRDCSAALAWPSDGGFEIRPAKWRRAALPLAESGNLRPIIQAYWYLVIVERATGNRLDREPTRSCTAAFVHRPHRSIVRA